jgi:hypothetical protein
MRLHHLLAASLGGLLILSPTHAGPIDDALLRRAPQLFRDLKAKGYKNVGILKFRVEKGGKAATFHAGPLNNNMTLRLEEALIRANDETNPIGITHNASDTAAETDGQLSYLTAEGRQKLLTLSYPLAWGSEKVKVDAFLTGVVQISPDFKTTVVRIQVFDTEHPELRELMQFDVQTDRNVLSDAGESFALKEPKITTRGELSGLAKAFDSDKPTSDKPSTPPVEEKKPPQGGGAAAPETKSDPSDFKKATMSTVAKVQLEIYYDDQLVQPMFDPNNPGEMMIPAPGTNQKVHFLLRNTTGEKVGVVLRVNGVNTLYKEQDDRDAKQYAKWILQPNKAYTIAGFYPDPQTVEKFQIRPPDTTKREEMGNVATQGLIQLDYFQEGTAEEAEPPSAKRSVSLRKLSHPDLAKDKPATLAELRARMRKMAAPVQTRNLIVAGEKQSIDLKEVSFDHAIHAGSLTIRYYQPKGRTP